MSSFKRGKKEVAQFLKRYGAEGKSVLDAFNEIDYIGLRPGVETPVDEYLSYAEKFMRAFSRAPARKRMTPNIAILLFHCFSPEEFLGIAKRYKTKGDIVLFALSSFGRTPSLTPKKIIILAELISQKMQGLSLRVVRDNKPRETAQ